MDKKFKIIDFYKFCKGSNLNQSDLWKEASQSFANNNSRGYDFNYDKSIHKYNKLYLYVNKCFYLINKFSIYTKKKIHRILSLFLFKNHQKYKDYRLDLDFDCKKYLDEGCTVDFLQFYNSLKEKLKLYDSYSTIRVIYYFYHIYKEIEQKESLNVIEIGGGVCNLAKLLSTTVKNVNYFVVDLPDVMSFAYNKFDLNDVKLSLPHEYNDQKVIYHPVGKNIQWLLPDQLSTLARNKFDLVLNTESFAEMDPSVSKSYTSLIPDLLNPTGIYFSNNRLFRDISSHQTGKYTSPLFYNSFNNNLIIHKCFIDNFRASIKDYSDTPNLIEIYKKNDK